MFISMTHKITLIWIYAARESIDFVQDFSSQRELYIKLLWQLEQSYIYFEITYFLLFEFWVCLHMLFYFIVEAIFSNFLFFTILNFFIILLSLNYYFVFFSL